MLRVTQASLPHASLPGLNVEHGHSGHSSAHKGVEVIPWPNLNKVSF